MAVDETIRTLEREQKGLEQERDDLRSAGDEMQSALSRIIEWASLPHDRQDKMPYEVAMACVEGRSAVELWTEIRRLA